MITLASGKRVWLAVGRTDMRKGFDELSALIQQKLTQDPFCGHLFVFRGFRCRTAFPALMYEWPRLTSTDPLG